METNNLILQSLISTPEAFICVQWDFFRSDYLLLIRSGQTHILIGQVKKLGQENPLNEIMHCINIK